MTEEARISGSGFGLLAVGPAGSLKHLSALGACAEGLTSEKAEQWGGAGI